MKRSVVTLQTLVMLFGGSMSLWAQVGPPPGSQRGGPRPQLGGLDGPRNRDPLDALKRALRDSDAQPLTESQEQQILALIQALRENRPDGVENGVLHDARQTYQDAVLTGDFAGAQQQAAVIGEHVGQMTTTKLEVVAQFKIGVLEVLDADQIGSYQQRIGSRGLSRLLNTLTRGPRPRGGGPGGPGEFPDSSGE